MERFIAKDTKEPLIVLGGYEIAKDGGIIRKYVDITDQNIPEITEEDLELLNEHGADGLAKLGYYGVLDRLQRAGVIGTDD